jgi:spore maturation protein CgeB
MRIFIFKTGGSMVPYILQDIQEALEELGHTLKELDLSQGAGPSLTPNEVVELVKGFRPDFVLGINYLGIASRIVTSMKIPYVCWFFDDPFYFRLKKESISPYLLLFVVDKGWIKGLKEFGFKRVEPLPCATNPRVFKKIDLSNGDIERYGCNISFVGSSTYLYYERCRREGGLAKEAMHLLRKDPSLEFKDLLRRLDINPLSQKIKDMHEFRVMVEYGAAALQKKEIVEAIGDLGIHIYGDDGWGELIRGGVRVFPRIDYRGELPVLYNASAINLNITKPQLKTGLNPRIFNISACGSFVLTDHRCDLERVFNGEIISYHNTNELREIIRYYLDNPSEREELAKRARRRVVREHTYEVRMKRMVEVFEEVQWV